jgi:hypothetical protein
VERGFVDVLATQPDPTYLCNTGCLGSKTHIDSFFYDVEDNHCYPRCFDTYEPICYNGIVATAVPLSTDPIAIANTHIVNTNRFCPEHFPMPTQRSLIDRGVPGELLWPGWGLDLRSDACGETAPELVSVCRGRGKISQVNQGGDLVCDVDTCGTQRASFLHLASSPFETPAVGAPCFYDCWTAQSQCIGWRYAGEGTFPYAGYATSEASLTSCATTMTDSGYQGFSRGASGIQAPTE